VEKCRCQGMCREHGGGRKGFGEEGRLSVRDEDSTSLCPTKGSRKKTNKGKTRRDRDE
jgi:hypothetical protein